VGTAAAAAGDQGLSRPPAGERDVTRVRLASTGAPAKQNTPDGMVRTSDRPKRPTRGSNGFHWVFPATPLRTPQFRCVDLTQATTAQTDGSATSHYADLHPPFPADATFYTPRQPTPPPLDKPSPGPQPASPHRPSFCHPHSGLPHSRCRRRGGGSFRQSLRRARRRRRPRVRAGRLWR